MVVSAGSAASPDSLNNILRFEIQHPIHGMGSCGFVNAKSPQNKFAPPSHACVMQVITKNSAKGKSAGR